MSTWMLDAADYGVPQRRRRIFLVAGPVAVPAPAPTHGDPDQIRQTSMFAPARHPWVTVRQALGLGGASSLAFGHGREEGYRLEPQSADDPSVSISGSAGGSSRPFVVLGGGSNQPESRSVRDLTDAPATTILAEPAGKNEMRVMVAGIATARAPGVAVRDRARVDLMDRPAWTVSADVGRSRGGAMEVLQSGIGHTDGGSRGVTRSVDSPAPAMLAASQPERLDRPCLTVTASESHGTRGESMYAALSSKKGSRGGPARASDGMYLATGIRRLTVAECAAVQDFPPDYPWQGTKTAQYRQVGNAVPPSLAEAIARVVLAADAALEAPAYGPAARIGTTVGG